MAKFDQIDLKTKNGMSLVFRNIDGKDAEKILAFRKQVAIETTNTMQYVGQLYPTAEETAKILNNQLQDSTTINVGVFDGKTLVGYLNFRLPWAGHPWVAHLAQFGMFILRSYWGLGIGKKLIAI